MDTLVVNTIEGSFELGTQDEFTFGRSERCTYRLDETDRNISRIAGTISWRDTRWGITNTSAKRSLLLMDHVSGNAYNLLPGRLHVICEDRLTVSMPGTDRSVFEFDVVCRQRPGRTDDGSEQPSDGPSTLGPPTLSLRQREDLSALFIEYRRADGGAPPKPKTYAEAAVLIGDTSKALEHRVAYLRKRLLRDGYPRMDLHQLAIFLLATQLLTPADFDALGASRGL